MTKKIQIILPATIFIFLLLAANANAATYDLYVDAGSAGALEDGSAGHPFKKIGTALKYINDHKLKKKNIFIASGTYKESITLQNNVKLSGESRSGTIIDGEGKGIAVYFKSTSSKLKNFTVRSASNNVVIDAKSKAVIEKCTIESAKRKGIEVKKSSNRKTYKFTLYDSSVKDNDRYGAHISKREIDIKKSYIHDNGEEGLDLHSGVKGKISNNRIKKNGESGIELVVGGAKIEIKSNKITDNESQGVAIQFYSADKGKISLKQNTVSKNHKYGVKFVRFAKSIKEGFRNFINSTVKFSANKIGGNGDGDYNYNLK